jgi:hypothetical protein
MTREPTPLELEALIAVVETGSERAAAQRLGLTQHGVHKRMAVLRRRLQTPTLLATMAVGFHDGWLDVGALELPAFVPSTRRVSKHPPRLDAARFWSKVDRSGGPTACWPWIAGGRHGYGAFSIADRPYPAHRIALLMSGAALGDDQLACHRCDNPPCCNPAHLFPGTNADNVADMWAKGRSAQQRSRV